VIAAHQTVPHLSASSPLTELRGIGPKRSAALAAAGIRTIGDLLLHLPARYEDRRWPIEITAITGSGRYLLRGRLEELKRVRIRRRKLILIRGFLSDGANRLAVLWFNQPYLLRQIDPEAEYSLYGDVRERGTGFELVNPSIERLDGEADTEAVVPVYPGVGDLSGGLVRKLIRQVLGGFDPRDLAEPLPDGLLEKYELPPLGLALDELHRPAVDADLEVLNGHATAAHARLCYGEFLELQLELGYLRGFEMQVAKRHCYVQDERTRHVLLEILPFRLTAAQRQALKEISTDLGRPHAMLRLLQGDVGSGKTIVAVLALVMALESGLQGAFMAPTELLAEQHFRSLELLLGGRYRLALLSRSVGDSSGVRRAIAEGAVQLVVGTHALIQDSVRFADLGLVVVDEQHRFGVAQRRLLQEKGALPDVLVMTATPIPRSLALTVYGDLSLSVIDELPPGRQPIATRVAEVAERRQVYEWLRRELATGSQAYVVFPRIGDGDDEGVGGESITARSRGIQEALSGFECAILHGRMDRDQRLEIMHRFRAGNLKVLIATTVIEVGVDVPDATVMIIEGAERFGLSQLHQLRGRVGRGARPSTCWALHGELSDEARRRLEVFAGTCDGFEIAEADLEIRGPGDLLGTRQSGAPWFRLADIIRDRDWLERARRDARQLIRSGRDLALSPGFLSEIRRRARGRYEAFGGG
jgi:ATP-dependent DNA helicase RecG